MRVALPTRAPIYSNLFQPSDNLRTVSLAKDKHSNRGMESAADYLFANSPLPVSPPRRTRRGGWKPRRPLQSRPPPNCSRQPRQSHLISTKADIQISRKHSTPWRVNRGRVLEARATFSAAKLPFFTRLSHSAS